MKFFSTIWGWFSGTSIGKYLIEGFLLIGAIGGLYAKVRLDGEHAQQGKDAERTVKDMTHANEIRNEVEKLPSGAAQSELEKDWSAK